MNILVTGANGQLGNELRRLAPQHGSHQFFFTDVEELDITDAQAIFTFVKKESINLVINCAAFTAVDKAENQQELCHLLNAEAPGFLAAAMNEVDGWMLQISTDYVFDGTSHVPYRETDPTAPIGVYGRTKLEGEEIVMRTCPKGVIVRTAWLYSSFGNNFVKTMIRLGREREELGVVFDQIGTPTYAADLADAVLQMVEHGLVAGIYHYSNEGVTSWYDFAQEIHRQAGITNCLVRPLHTAEYPTPAQRPHYSVLDKNKIRQTYGISIPWWGEALTRCISELTQF